MGLLRGLLAGILLTTVYPAIALDLTRSVALTYDKAGVPPTWYLLRGENAGETFNTRVTGMVCGSTSGITTGACPTRMSYAISPPFASNFGGEIRLEIRNETLSARREIVLKSFRVNDCSARYLWDNVACAGDGPMSVYIYILADELRKVPSGVWTGSLVMFQRNSSDTVTQGTWRVNLTLNVTDNRNQQIYFPEYRTSSPTVGLKLNNRPGTGNNIQTSGNTAVDMCLYDGSNSSSNHISILFQDEGSSAPGRPGGQFSVYRQGGDKSRAADRVDYQVSVINPVTGASQLVSNNQEVIWNNTNQRNLLRQVILPGVPGISLCVPAPIRLITPAFRLADKNAGHYTGRLRIIYTPTTQTSVNIRAGSR